LASDPAWAFVFAPLLAAAYLVTVTSLSTILQEHVDEETRGRVMALWLMGFAGAAPVGVLVGGVVARVTSIRVVLIVGTVVSLAMALVAERRGLTATADAPRHRQSG
jgi:MFS family permease